jgi:hypothetical protein
MDVGIRFDSGVCFIFWIFSLSYLRFFVFNFQDSLKVPKTVKIQEPSKWV